MERNYKTIIEDAGAVFVAVKNGSVHFRDPEDLATLSRYCFACRSAEDVRLALKNHREPTHDFEPLISGT